MVGMITGFWVSQLVRAVADLNLSEHLADGGLSAAELAEREGGEPDSTSRLLRAAAALGLLTRGEDGRFHGTPLLATLRRDVAGSLRGLALGGTRARALADLESARERCSRKRWPGPPPRGHPASPRASTSTA